MLPCLATDLTTIFSASDFAEAAGTVTLNGVALAGTGIFDNGDAEVSMGEGPSQIVAIPTFTCPSSLIVGITDSQIMVIRGRSYRVTHWKDDQTGVITIYLEGP
jgi:hypothetical protein